MNQFIAAALGAFLIALAIYLSIFRQGQKTPSQSPAVKEAKEAPPELSKTATATPRDFDYRSVEPVAYRPFLSHRHYNIGITKCTKEDWIQIDRGYLDRIRTRKQTLETYPDKCHAVNHISGAKALAELFEILIEHLPVRFPSIFELDRERNIFTNHVTDIKYNLKDFRSTPRQMTRLLVENVEDDFYMMCPDEERGYVQQALVSCFPNSFMPPSKLGLAMKDIHRPVPGLQEKIGKGIDLSMKSLRGGSIIQSLQFQGNSLFRTGGNNFEPKPGEVLGDLSEPQDLSECYLRIERQSLARLPETRAIAFCIRHYVYPLEDIKKEGNGDELADAIQSMPEKLGYYKRRPFWQRDVDAFLRGKGKGA
ncbi:MAG: hypothetical protein LQ350_005664 [Teloschistes chrysophthalmus]|nr:MAG: hypothetical protein LQ350_005664 [Niorma chrysophthalma]